MAASKSNVAVVRMALLSNFDSGQKQRTRVDIDISSKGIVEAIQAVAREYSIYCWEVFI